MYKKILVPLDGSKRAEKILSHVEQLAHSHNARVIFLTVVRPLKIIAYDTAEVKNYHEKFAKQLEQTEKYLTALQGEFKEKGIESTHWVEMGPVVTAILDAAERESVDLIAISSHGRGGLSRLFYGSVAAGILQRVDRPLLVIRSRRDS